MGSGSSVALGRVRDKLTITRKHKLADADTVSICTHLDILSTLGFEKRILSIDLSVPSSGEGHSRSFISPGAGNWSVEGSWDHRTEDIQFQC